MSITSETIIIIVLIIMNAFLIWRSFGSIPRDLPEWVLRFGAEQAAKTESKLDDRLVEILQGFFDSGAISVTPPPDAPADNTSAG